MDVIWKISRRSCNGANVAPERASTTHVRDYMRYVAERGMAASTQARRLSTLRRFFRFLLEDQFREDDPTSTLDAPKIGQRLPKYLSEEDVDGLLAAARERGGADGLRLSALLEILYATGLRVSELVTLPVASFVRESPVLLVRGKGEKERMVPLGEPAQDAVRAYMDIRDSYLPKGRVANRAQTFFVSVAR